LAKVSVADPASEGPEDGSHFDLAKTKLDQIARIVLEKVGKARQKSKQAG
jgi:hypothetical protein